VRRIEERDESGNRPIMPRSESRHPPGGTDGVASSKPKPRSQSSRHPPGGTDGPARMRTSSRPVVTIEQPSRSGSRQPAGSSNRSRSRPKLVKA
jgi:hypothetical protein